MNVYTTRTFLTKRRLLDVLKDGTTESVFRTDVPDGRHIVVGPDKYSRKWYANVTVKDSIITKINR